MSDAIDSAVHKVVVAAAGALDLISNDPKARRRLDQQLTEISGVPGTAVRLTLHAISTLRDRWMESCNGVVSDDVDGHIDYQFGCFNFGDPVEIREANRKRVRRGLVVTERFETRIVDGKEESLFEPQVQVLHLETQQLAWHSRYLANLVASMRVSSDHRKVRLDPLRGPEFKFGPKSIVRVVALRRGKPYGPQSNWQCAVVLKLCRVPTTPISNWYYVRYFQVVRSQRTIGRSTYHKWLPESQLVRCEDALVLQIAADSL